MVNLVDHRTPGRRLLAALSTGAFDDLETIFAPAMRFRALLPKTVRTCTDPVAAADYYRAWFGPERVERLQPMDGRPYPFKETSRCSVVAGAVGEPVVGKVPIRYLLDLENRSGHCRCEQHGFYTVDDEGRMASLDVVCSGILPVPEPDTPAAD